MALAHFQRTFTDASGNVKPGLSVTVRRESDNGLAALFADAGSVTPKSNPFNTDANGYGSFYVVDGRYRIQATDIDWRNEDLIGQPIVDFGSTTDDVDTIVKSGFYRVESNANLPSGSDYGQLIVSRGWDTIMQLVSSYNGRLWQRSGNPSNIGANGSYSDWQEIPSLAGGAAANFASMPQVGGDPIVESGSNADGEWTRWADGKQTCESPQTAMSFSAVFDINFSWDYPAAFISTPTVVPILVYTAYYFRYRTTASTLQYVRSISTTGATIGLASDSAWSTADAAGDPMQGLASGRWK